MGGAVEEGVVVEAVDAELLVEIVEPRLPLERARVQRLEAEFLGRLAVALERIGAFVGKGNEAGPERRRIRSAEAAVDVAAAERLHVLVAGDRVERVVAQLPAQPGAAAAGVELLVVLAVGVDGAGVEVVDQVVGLGLDDDWRRKTRAVPSRSRPCRLKRASKSLFGL